MTTSDYKARFTFSKYYRTVAKFRFRSNIFKNNLVKFEGFNADPVNTSIFGINMLTDRTEVEMKKINV